MPSSEFPFCEFIIGVAATASVAGGEIKMAIRPEIQFAAVVVRVGGVWYREDNYTGTFICRVRVACLCLKTRDAQVAGCIGVVNKKIAVALIVWMKCDAQQSPFAAPGNAVGYIEEIARKQCASRNDPYLSALLYHEKPVTAVAGIHYVYRRTEPAGNNRAVNEYRYGLCEDAGGK